MSVKINVPFLIVFLFICFKGVVGKNCGNLSYSQPAFNGGNVTITYKPIKFSATEKPIIFNSDGNTWIPVPSTIMSNPVLGVFTTVFKTNILITVYLHAKYGPCYSEEIRLHLQDPPSTLTMNVPNITSYSQDIYTLKFSCFTDKNNDFCLISWTTDGQLLRVNGYGTDKIHNSSLMLFVNVSKENNGQTITCSVNCSNFDVQLSKSHIVQVPYKPSVILSVKDEVWLNAHDTTSVTCTAKSQPLSDIVWSVNGNTQLLVCNKSIECEIHTLPIETDEHRNHTCTAFFEFGDYDTSATISFLAIGRASTQKTYETPNKSKDASLTNSNDIPMVWIVIGLSVIIAVVIISPVIVLARKRFLKKNQHTNSSEPQPVQHGFRYQPNLCRYRHQTFGDSQQTTFKKEAAKSDRIC
ncbi:uncharacterized protein LOC128206243 isoform X2 [Mya arenaria]|uniref:uncharacterized protein LOC128206243 isoform X2 n=1 Tax=Mya arenaria TaxID=6604 RepID=UPI0022E15F68|nr:uncharacterized protein LOC128206243 isoform X2 [Mya arenaria]